MTTEYVCPICGTRLVIDDSDDDVLAAVRRGTFDRWVAEHEREHDG